MVPQVWLRRLLCLSALALVFAFAAPRAVPAISISPDQTEIRNFGEINENYFRGGQPDQEGFRRLGKLGVKTVIDLQEEGLGAEPGWVQDAGMKYFRIPLSGSRPATDAQTAQFLQLVNDPANWPVYVHCAAGRHRTGEMTGIYRITHDSWSADQAYREMQRFGYYSFPSHGSLKRYVYAYYDSHRSKLGASTDSTIASAGPVNPDPTPAAARP